MSLELNGSSRLVRFERTFRENLSIVYIEIENESAQHAGHYSGDGETHWRVLIAAEEFRGLPRVQRHQKMNELVKEEFARGLHALSLQLYDPDEWQRNKQNYFEQES